jgi:hypothetical protein
MSITAMKQALDALEECRRDPRLKYEHLVYDKTITALRTAIAEAERHQAWNPSDTAYRPGGLPQDFIVHESEEPVAWLGLEPSDMPDGDDPMYDHDFFLKGMVWADVILRKKNATPPAEQRQWAGLTDDEIKEIIGPWGDTPIKGYTRKLFDAIEAKLKEKNHG